MPRTKHADRITTPREVMDKLLYQNKLSITYHPSWVKVIGSVTGVILLQQAYYLSRGSKSDDGRFSKFKEPCKHPNYKKGQSWTEELGFGLYEFDGALGLIGQRIDPKDSSGPTAKNDYDKPVIYWGITGGMTWYKICWPTFWNWMERVYRDVPSGNFPYGKNQDEELNLTLINKTLINKALIKNINIKPDVQKKKIVSADNNYTKLSKLFLQAQKKNWPRLIKTISPSSISRGADQLDKLVRIDGFDFTEIKDALHWLVQTPDHFWCKNLRSLASIRKVCRDGQTKFAHVLSEYLDYHAARDRQKGITPRSCTDYKTKVIYNLLLPLHNGSGFLSHAAEDMGVYYSNLPDTVKAHFGYSGGSAQLVRGFVSYCKKAKITNMSASALCPLGKMWQNFIIHTQKSLCINFDSGKPI